MKKSLALGAAALALLLSGAAGAVDEEEIFESWDTNGDEILTQAEFTEGASGPDGLFQSWRLDDDDTLSTIEMCTGVYHAWTDDGDDRLSIERWDRMVDRWYGEEAVNLQVAEWDSDGDDTITRGEFCRAFGTAGLYTAFDANDDSAISEDELYEGLYTAADGDADGQVAYGDDDDLVDDWWVD